MRPPRTEKLLRAGIDSITQLCHGANAKEKDRDMPVLGHAFVGFATGLVTRPCQDPPQAPRDVFTAHELWLPAAVALAYVPDIIAKVLPTEEIGDMPDITHSLLFALCFSLVAAPALSRWRRVSYGWAFGFLLFSLLAHDLSDLLQHARPFWWPLSHYRIGNALLPTTLGKETLIFTGLFFLFLASQQLFADDNTNAFPRGQCCRSSLSRRNWLSKLATAAIILAAATTHYLSDLRENQFEIARNLLWAERDTATALLALAQAERWPSSVQPSRIDYLYAEAYRQLGDRDKAEHYYLRSYRADPTYFWVVADLASFYASSPLPLNERRRLAAPYMRRLQHEFTEYGELSSQVVQHMRRQLQQPHVYP